MTYEELVKKCTDAYAKADASAITEHVAIQFNVTGEGEGAFYLEVADGKIDIQPFEYYDRDAIVTTNAQAIIDIVSGKLNVTDAYNSGVLYVDGNLGKASLLSNIVLKKEPEKKAAAKKEEPAKEAPAKKACAKKTCAKKTTTAKKTEPAKAATAKKTTK